MAIISRARCGLLDPNWRSLSPFVLCAVVVDAGGVQSECVGCDGYAGTGKLTATLVAQCWPGRPVRLAGAG